MTLLERYRAIIPDWEGFRETILRRDPPTLRVRTGRISTGALKDRLQAQGFVLTEVEGLPDFFRVTDFEAASCRRVFKPLARDSGRRLPLLLTVRLRRGAGGGPRRNL